MKHNESLTRRLFALLLALVLTFGLASTAVAASGANYAAGETSEFMVEPAPASHLITVYAPVAQDPAAMFTFTYSLLAADLGAQPVEGSFTLGRGGSYILGPVTEGTLWTVVLNAASGYTFDKTVWSNTMGIADEAVLPVVLSQPQASVPVVEVEPVETPAPVVVTDMPVQDIIVSAEDEPAPAMEPAPAESLVDQNPSAPGTVFVRETGAAESYGTTYFRGVKSSDPNRLNYNQTNTLVAQLQSGVNAADYVFAWQHEDHPITSGGKRTILTTAPLGTEAPQYVRWSFDPASTGFGAGLYGIYAYAAGTTQEEIDSMEHQPVDSVRIRVYKVTFDPGEGHFSALTDNDSATLQEDGKVVAYAFADEWIQGVLEATPALEPASNDNGFICWTFNGKGTNMIPYITDINMNDITLTASYGEPVREGINVYATGDGSKVSVLDQAHPFVKSIEYDYVPESGAWNLTVENTGNQPLRFSFKKDYEYFNITTTASLSGDYYEIPVGGQAGLTITPLEGLRPGTYPVRVALKIPGLNVMRTVSYVLQVKRVAVNLTLANLAEKEYGTTMDARELIAGATVAWNDPQNKNSAAPLWEDLNIHLACMGLSSDANVGRHVITVASCAGDYDVILQGSPMLTVGMSTVRVSKSFSPTLGINEPLSDITNAGVTFEGVNTHHMVYGTFAWDNGDQSWDVVGMHEVGYTFTPADGNHAVYHGTMNVEVTAKMPVMITMDEAATHTVYDATPKSVTFNVTPMGEGGQAGVPVVEYTAEGDVDHWTADAPVDAGVYKVRALVPDTETCAAVEAYATLFIDRKPLTFECTAANKVYDGTTDASVSILVMGVVGTDNITATASGHFGTKDVGNGKSVVIPRDTVVLNSTNGREDNYILPGVSDYYAAANITPKPVAIRVNDVTKVYGTRRFFNNDDFEMNVTQGLAPGDSKADLHIELVSEGSVKTADVGTYPITVTWDSSNYDVTISNKDMELTVIKADPVSYPDVFAGAGKNGSKLDTVPLWGSFVNKDNTDMEVQGQLHWADGNNFTLNANAGNETNSPAWVFEPTGRDAQNYNIARGNALIMVNTRDVSGITIGDTVIPYDGSEHPLSVSVASGQNYTVEYMQMGTDATPGTDWTTTAPKDAGAYLVRITVDENIQYTGQRLFAPMVIMRVDPVLTNISASDVYEGQMLLDSVVTGAMGVNGESLTGSYVWDESSPETDRVYEDDVYGFVFSPNAPWDQNYNSVHGTVSIKFQPDNRQIAATIYNLPDNEAYRDYAVIDIAASQLREGESIEFFEDAECTKARSEEVVIVKADGKISIPLNVLKDAGGTLYVKILGKTTAQVTAIDYLPEIDFTTKSPVTLKVGDSYNVDITQSDRSYQWQRTVVLGNDNRFVDTSRGSGIIEAVAPGETSAMVQVTFMHPDQENHPGYVVTVFHDIDIVVEAKDEDMPDPTPTPENPTPTKPPKPTPTPTPIPGGDAPSEPTPTPGGDEPSTPTPTPGGDEPSEPTPTPDGDEPSEPTPTPGGDEPSNPTPTPGGDTPDNPPSGNEKFKIDNRTGVSVITDEMKAAGYPDAESVMAALRNVVNTHGFSENNMITYDLILMVSHDNGATWSEATDADIPASGLYFTIPYPSGTNARDYVFMIAHMRSHGAMAGTIETPTVETTNSGIRFKPDGLSPISLAWRARTASDPTPGPGGTGGIVTPTPTPGNSGGSTTVTPTPVPTPHTHTYSTTWSTSASQHWHACTANDGAQTDVGNHTLVIKYDGSGHWSECTVCGYKASVINHVFVNGKCTVCGITEAEANSYSSGADGTTKTPTGSTTSTGTTADGKGKAEAVTGTTATENPKTGDETNVGLWVAVIAVFGVALGTTGFVVYRKHKAMK